MAIVRDINARHSVASKLRIEERFELLLGARVKHLDIACGVSDEGHTSVLGSKELNARYFAKVCLFFVFKELLGQQWKLLKLQDLAIQVVNFTIIVLKQCLGLELAIPRQLVVIFVQLHKTYWTTQFVDFHSESGL